MTAFQRWTLVLLTAALASGCASSTPTPSASALRVNPSAAATSRTSTPTPALPSSQAIPAPRPVGGVYAFTAAGKLAPRVAGLKPLVYVPNENSGDVAVIDPATFTIVGRFRTGLSPEHIVPDWDLSRLYVTDMGSSRLTVIDPPAAAAARAIGVPYPYNLYFTVDGSKAIVVDDFLGARDLARNGLAFYDRKTWKLLKWLEIPRTGANHLDMSADGSFMLVSGETSGWVVKVDTRRMSVVGEVRVGGLPIDVRLSPDGRYFFVANQGEGGVNVIDARTLKVVSFIRTGTGAHGLGISRDTTKLYVTNRLAGSISVIEVATQTVTATWQVGASPDMMAFSADGSQMWVSNRYDGTIVVIDPARGIVLRTIATGANPHGLVYWPQPGRYSISTGITR